MALDGVIFDLDGTLVDTNAAHVEAWRRAFARYGYKVMPDRIAVEIGKGGDLLVSAVLGRRAEEEHGKLRDASAEEFLGIAGAERFAIFSGAEELLKELRSRGLRLALATSSKKKHLEGTLGSAGLDLGLFDEVVTADDIRISKPAPDIVAASLGKLRLSPAQCAMVGDTPYDAEAARHAGVVCLGLLCGGNREAVLRAAGAWGVWDDARDLLEHLEEALALASPGAVHWTWQRLEDLMREALGEARRAAADGELPVGCALARGDGTVVGRAGPQAARSGNAAAHAPVVALQTAADGGAGGLVFAVTSEPCIQCTGAAVEVGADMIVFGRAAPANRGTARVLPPAGPGFRLPRVVGGVLEDECTALSGEPLAG